MSDHNGIARDYADVCAQRDRLASELLASRNTINVITERCVEFQRQAQQANERVELIRADCDALRRLVERLTAKLGPCAVAEAAIDQAAETTKELLTTIATAIAPGPGLADALDAAIIKSSAR